MARSISPASATSCTPRFTLSRTGCLAGGGQASTAPAASAAPIALLLSFRGMPPGPAAARVNRREAAAGPIGEAIAAYERVPERSRQPRSSGSCCAPSTSGGLPGPFQRGEAEDLRPRAATSPRRPSTASANAPADGSGWTALPPATPPRPWPASPRRGRSTSGPRSTGGSGGTASAGW